MLFDLKISVTYTTNIVQAVLRYKSTTIAHSKCAVVVGRKAAGA